MKKLLLILLVLLTFTTAPIYAVQVSLDFDANYSSIILAINKILEPSNSDIKADAEAISIKLDNLGFIITKLQQALATIGEKGQIGALLILGAIVYMEYDKKLKTKIYTKAKELIPGGNQNADTGDKGETKTNIQDPGGQQPAGEDTFRKTWE